MMHGLGFGWLFHGGWMLGGGLVLLVVLAGLLWWLLRADTADDPEAVLHRRYAAGEIDEREYRDRLYYLWKGRRASRT